MSTRVVVAEDGLIVREGLQRLLAASPSVDVVAAYGDADSLLAAVERDRPDIVLTDIRMPPSNSDEGIRLADHTASLRTLPSAVCQGPSSKRSSRGDGHSPSPPARTRSRRGARCSHRCLLSS